jgi:hypothetical protein
VNQEAEFPRPIDFNGAIVFERSRVEDYKARIVAAAVGGAAPEYVKPAVETFVTARDLARELGFSRRTLGRKIKGMIKIAPPNANTANSETA